MCVFKKKPSIGQELTHMQCMVIKAYTFQGETTTSSMTGYVQ